MRFVPLRTLGVALLVLGSALLPAAVAGKRPFVAGDRLEFRAVDLEGNVVRHDDPRFVGKVLLVDLWGTWCPPCLSEIPTFVDLQRRYRERGLVIVAIAFEDEPDGEQRRAYLAAFARDHGINYLVLDGGRPDDFEEALPDVRNVRGFPVEIVIDRGGRVVDARNGYGYKKKWARKLDDELRALLDQDY